MRFRRREFLAIAPAGALASGALSAGTAFAGPCGAGRVHTADRATRLPVALGYWEGSDAVEPDSDPFELTADGGQEIEIRDDARVPRLGSALFDAASLPAGDPRFLLGPARVRILGLMTGDAGIDRGTPSLTLRVKSDPARDYVHDAWSFQNGDLPSISSPVAVTVPVDRTDGLHLAIAVASAEAEREELVRLSLGIGAGPKLRRGLYLLSWGARAVPAWRDYGLAAVEPEQPEDDPASYRLVGRGLLQPRLDAPVLAFTIDFAPGDFAQTA